MVKISLKKGFFKDPYNSKLVEAILNAPANKVNIFEDGKNKLNKITGLYSYTVPDMNIYEKHICFNFTSYNDTSNDVFNHFIEKNDNMTSTKEDELSCIPPFYVAASIEDDEYLFNFITINKLIEKLLTLLDFNDFKINEDNFNNSKYIPNGFSMEILDKTFNDRYRKGITICVSYLE